MTSHALIAHYLPCLRKENLMTGQPPLERENSKVAARIPLRKTWIIAFALIMVVIASGFLLPNGPLLHALAAGLTPAKPTSINATPGNQQASLTWAPSLGATGY